MKGGIFVFLVLGVVLVIIGCLSDYVILIKDGYMMIIYGKLEWDKDIGLILYKDVDGSIY